VNPAPAPGGLGTFEVNSSPSLVLDTPEGPIVITGEAVGGPARAGGTMGG
jgi:hypothetical protein